jgi:hypothetical protein
MSKKALNNEFSDYDGPTGLYIATGEVMLALCLRCRRFRLVGASRMQSKHLRHWGPGSHGVPSFWVGSPNGLGGFKSKASSFITQTTATLSARVNPDGQTFKTS